MKSESNYGIFQLFFFYRAADMDNDFAKWKSKFHNSSQPPFLFLSSKLEGSLFLNCLFLSTWSRNKASIIIDTHAHCTCAFFILVVSARQLLHIYCGMGKCKRKDMPGFCDLVVVIAFSCNLPTAVTFFSICMTDRLVCHIT